MVKCYQGTSAFSPRSFLCKPFSSPNLFYYWSIVNRSLSLCLLRSQMRFICRPDISKDDPLVASAIHSLDLAVLKKRTKLEQLMIPNIEPEVVTEEFHPISDEVNIVIRECRSAIGIHELSDYKVPPTHRTSCFSWYSKKLCIISSHPVSLSFFAGKPTGDQFLLFSYDYSTVHENDLNAVAEDTKRTPKMHDTRVSVLCCVPDSQRYQTHHARGKFRHFHEQFSDQIVFVLIMDHAGSTRWSMFSHRGIHYR